MGLNTSSAELTQAVRDMGAALKRVAGQLRDAVKEAFDAAWRKVVAFSLAVWGFFIQLYRAAEEFLTGVILVVRFPALGIGLTWAGLSSGIWVLTVAGVGWLLVLGVAFAFFRNKGEPHPESPLVLRLAKWTARAMLFAGALFMVYITNPALRGVTSRSGPSNVTFSDPKPQRKQDAGTREDNVIPRLPRSSNDVKRAPPKISRNRPPRQVLIDAKPALKGNPARTKTATAKPPARKPKEGVDPFSSASGIQ